MKTNPPTTSSTPTATDIPSTLNLASFAGSCFALRERVAAGIDCSTVGVSRPVMEAMCNRAVLAYAGDKGQTGEALYGVQDGVALIPVVGVMMRSDSEVVWGGQRFGTSHAMVRRALEQTQADASVKARVLVIDSPGGVADGSVALGEDVMQARGGKPIESFTIGAYSAAMWLAAQTSRITMEKGSGVGSIGTYMVVRDYSQMLQDAGIKSHLISSGGVKGQGALGVPVSDKALEHWQETVDTYTGYFIDALAAGRGLARSQVEKLANGQEYIGPAAVAAGLVDGEGTLASVVKRLGQAGGIAHMQGRTTVADGGRVPVVAAQEPPERQGVGMAGESTAAAGGGGGGGGGSAAVTQTQNVDASVVAKIADGKVVEQAVAAVADKVAAWTQAAAPFAGDENVSKALSSLMEKQNLQGLSVEAGQAKILEAVAAGRQPVGQVTEGVTATGHRGEEKFASDMEMAIVAQHVPEVGNYLSGKDREKAFAIADAMGYATPEEAVRAMHAARRGGLTQWRLSNLLEHFARRTAQRAKMTFGHNLIGDRMRQAELALGVGAFGQYAGGGILASGGHSTSDLSNLVANVMNKTLLVGLAEAPRTWMEWCVERSAADFKDLKYISLSELGSFDEVPEGGRPKHTKLTDRAESFSVKARGKKLGITWQLLANDDLNGLARIPRELGISYGRTMEITAYAKLAANPAMSDGYNLFDNTNHLNNPTGAALGATALDTDIQALMTQKGDGEDAADATNGPVYLGLQPELLLVGVANGATAKQLYNDQFDPLASATNASRTNIVQGRARPVVSPYVSGTKRYLFASPNIAPVMAMAFLEGFRTPRIIPTGQPSQFGMEWEASGAFAAGVIGWKGAVYNAGA